MKRLFDITLSFLLLLILSPVMFIIYALIKITSRCHAFYWSRRVGKDNKLFWMPKFRTMKDDTPELSTDLLKNAHTYLLPIGHVCRKSSLDELPQLYSILIGQMSFVGPRPALYNQYDLIKLRTDCGVHSLVPGVTGWAQINGRDLISDEEKVKFDLEYKNRMSFWFDLKIILITFLKVIKMDGVIH